MGCDALSFVSQVVTDLDEYLAEGTERDEKKRNQMSGRKELLSSQSSHEGQTGKRGKAADDGHFLPFADQWG